VIYVIRSYARLLHISVNFFGFGFWIINAPSILYIIFVKGTVWSVRQLVGSECAKDAEINKPSAWILGYKS